MSTKFLSNLQDFLHVYSIANPAQQSSQQTQSSSAESVSSEKIAQSTDYCHDNHPKPTIFDNKIPAETDCVDSSPSTSSSGIQGGLVVDDAQEALVCHEDAPKFDDGSAKLGGEKIRKNVHFPPDEHLAQEIEPFRPLYLERQIGGNLLFSKQFTLNLTFFYLL